MATYGEFETYRDLSRGQYVVSAAKRRGKDGYVVKAFVIDERIRTKDEAQAAAKRFLSRVKAMRAAGEGKKSRFWAPVHESKMVPTGAFYATDRYQSSAQKLIAGRTRLDGPGMWAIVHAVYEGLRELQSATGRPHGALTPANVLISSVANLSKAKIVLADPAADGDLDPGMGELVDLRALGRLIYALVYFQEFRELGGWPIGESPEWDKLGKQAGAWQSLCNQLLDPGLRPGALTLESIASDFPKPERRGGVPGWAKIAAVVLVLGGAGAGLAVSGVGASLVKQVQGMFASGPAKDDDDPEVVPVEGQDALWREWCEVWVAWFGEVHAWVKRVPPERFADDPTLSSLFGSVDGEGGWSSLDPTVVGEGITSTRTVAGDLRVFEDDPSKLPRLPVGLASTEGMARATGAVDRIREIGEGLSAENWAAHGSVRDLSRRLEGLGLSATSEALQRMIRPLEARSNGLAVREAIDATLRSKDVIARVGERLDAIEAIGGRLSAVPGGEALRVSGLLRSAEVEAEGTGLELLESLDGVLTPRVAVLEDLDEQLARRWSGELAPRLLEEAGKPTGSGGAPDPGSLEYFRNLAYLAASLETEQAWADARVGWDGPGRVDGLRSRREALEAEIDGASSAAAELGSLGAEIALLENEVAAIRSLPLASGTDAEAIRERMGEADERIATLSGSLERLASAAAQDYETYAAGLAARDRVSTLGSALIDRVWVEQRDALLARFDGAGDLGELRARVGDLERGLAAIEAAVSDQPSTRSVRGLVSRERLEPMLDAERERAIAALVSRADFELGRARGGDVDAVETWAAAEAYGGWVASSEAMFGDLAGVAGMLDAFQPLSAEVSGGRTVLETMDAWRAHPTRAAYGDVFGPLEARVDAIRAIAIETDAGVLRGTAEDLTRAPVAFAAWRRLGELEAWPGSFADVQAERNLIGGLRAPVERLEDASRRAELLDELDTGGRVRWARAFGNASSVSELESLARLAGTFGSGEASDGMSGLSDVLEADAAYNLLTLRLRTAVQGLEPGAANDDRRRALVEEYLSRVDGLALASDAARRTWLDDLRESLEDGSVGVGAFRDRGPGRFGWEPTVDGDRVTYRKMLPGGRSETMEFERLDPSDHPVLNEAVYLATEEVSVGLFDAVADDVAGGWDRLNAPEVWTQLASVVSRPDAEYLGVRSWQVETDGNELEGIVPSRRWYPEIRTRLFFETVFGDAAAGQTPGEDTPMQSLPATAAAAWADMVGCRLPTAEEWRAALEAERAAVQGSNWHLRGPAFAAQVSRVRDWESDQALIGRAGRPVYPDQDIFPSGIRGLNAAEFGTGAEASSRPDGTGDRWLFEPVGGSTRGAAFSHLVGNVAEFVVDGAGQPAYFVIGGSALSPPELAVDEPIGPLLRAGLPARRLAGYSFADVGFRVAFDGAGITPEARPLEERLAEVVQTPALVLAGS